MPEEFKEFKLPTRIFDELFEVSGASNAYKGFILAIANEDGTPLIICKTDTQLTKAGLYHALEQHLEAIILPDSDPSEENS